METYKEKIAIIIPALNPDGKMISLYKNLVSAGFKHILLVDDGSTEENRTFFQSCKDIQNCTILEHTVNRGKGAALKTAFHHILANCPDIAGVVTVDCDGQHVLSDIDTCARLTFENPEQLIMGCRQFDDPEIPWRSRFGNKLTRRMIGLLCGIHVSDTQTGLRGLPVTLIARYFIETKGDRYEYEMNMLLTARENHIKIQEFPIQTIYLEKNESSHFNPLLDSIRIYKVFITFMLSSVSSFLIDILLFYLLGLILRPVIPAHVTVFGSSVLLLLRTVIARLFSSLYNFFMNKKQVFKNDSKSPSILVRYYILCVIQLMCSWLLVNHLFTFIPYATVRKCIIDTVLFAVSFVIQREWVFKSSL